MERTASDLRAEAYKTPTGALHFDILWWNFDPPTYEKWAKRVEEALHHQVGLLAERRHDFHDLDEDELSGIVSIALQNLNLDASAKVVNGNTDLTVQYNGFKWLGEAKLGHDVGKIFKGYLQLTTRYATGMNGQTRGGMLIYCTKGNAQVVLDGWKAGLEAQIPGCNAHDGEVQLAFRSDDECKATGAKLEILHIAVPLYHDPQDAKRGLSKTAKKAANDARKLARKKAAAAIRDA